MKGNEMSDDEGQIGVDHDDLISQIAARNREDGERASSAGESREQIKQFLEDTGVHPKAFSAMRVGMKIKKETAKLDWLRSMEIMLPMVASEIRNQSTPDMLDDADAAEPAPDDEDDDGYLAGAA